MMIYINIYPNIYTYIYIYIYIFKKLWWRVGSVFVACGSVLEIFVKVKVTCF